MYDKEFQNFLINLDKEKSQSEKARVNQAYGIYHDIVETEDRFCFVIDNGKEIKVVSQMTADNAIDFIKALTKCSTNTIFYGQLVLVACGIIKDYYSKVNKNYKKSFDNYLSEVFRLLYKEGKIDNLFISKILGIKKSKLDSVLRLLSAIKDTEEYTDTDSVTPETRKEVRKAIASILNQINGEHND